MSGLTVKVGVSASCMTLTCLVIPLADTLRFAVRCSKALFASKLTVIVVPVKVVPTQSASSLILISAAGILVSILKEVMPALLETSRIEGLTVNLGVTIDLETTIETI